MGEVNSNPEGPKKTCFQLVSILLILWGASDRIIFCVKRCSTLMAALLTFSFPVFAVRLLQVRCYLMWLNQWNELLLFSFLL